MITPHPSAGPLAFRGKEHQRHSSAPRSSHHVLLFPRVCSLASVRVNVDHNGLSLLLPFSLSLVLVNHHPRYAHAGLPNRSPPSLWNNGRRTDTTRAAPSDDGRAKRKSRSKGGLNSTRVREKIGARLGFVVVFSWYLLSLPTAPPRACWRPPDHFFHFGNQRNATPPLLSPRGTDS